VHYYVSLVKSRYDVFGVIWCHVYVEETKNISTYGLMRDPLLGPGSRPSLNPALALSQVLIWIWGKAPADSEFGALQT